MKRLWHRLTSRFRSSTTSSPASWFVEWIRGGAQSDSGVEINGSTFLRYAPVWYAINKIAGHVGQLPCELRKWEGEQSKRVTTHPAYWLINWQPNEMMNPSVFREVVQGHALGWGNGRAAIHRNNRRDPAELIPLLPDRTITVLVNGEKWHVTTIIETGEKIRIRDNDVLHICGFGYDGIQGYSLIDMARNSWGAGLAGEKQVNRHFKNNAIPGMVLEAPPGVFRDEAKAKEFLSEFNKYHSGVDNANKVALLREGIKASTLGVSGRDAQWLEERVFQRQEVALWFLLEQILGDGASVSYNSLEQKNQGYLANCLMRWLVKWEEELARKLLTRAQFESANFYWKFKTAALLRGTTKERYDVYSLAITHRIMNPNEVRALEDMPPYEGGNEYANPNTTTGTPATAPESDPDQDNPPTPAPPPEDTTARLTHIAQTAIAARLTGWAKVERERLADAANKHAHRFVSWLDEFYEDFQPWIVEGILDSGGMRGDAEAWISLSKERMLDCAGRATFDTLGAVVSEELKNWPDRKRQLAAALAQRQAVMGAA